MNVVNSGLTVSPQWAIHICIRAFSLAHRKFLIWNGKEQKTAHPPWGKIPTIPLWGRERKNRKERVNDKRSDSYYFQSWWVLQQLSLALCFLECSKSPEVHSLLQVWIEVEQIQINVKWDTKLGRHTEQYKEPMPVGFVQFMLNKRPCPHSVFFFVPAE